MKVAIVEMCNPNHAVMIYNWSIICERNGWDFQVFTTRDISNQVVNEVFSDRISLVENTSPKSFYKLRGQLKDSDIIVITSMQGFFFSFLWLLRLNGKLVLTVHNLNTWFLSELGSGSLKKIAKNLIRSFWLKQASGILVNSSNMKSYLDKARCCEKPLEAIPFSLKQKAYEVHSCHPSNLVRPVIVYPGMVSKKRKDYLFFLDLAKVFDGVDFVLLGKVMSDEGGDEIVREIQEASLDNVKFYKDYVSQEEFDEVMSRAWLVYAYVNVHYSFDGVPEIYGVTKDSGVSYFMSEYSLPLLVNSEFKNLKELDHLTHYYDGYDSLETLVRRFTKDPAYWQESRSRIAEARNSLSINEMVTRADNFIARL